MDKDFQKYLTDIKTSCKNRMGMVGIYRFTLENEDGSKEVKYYHNIICTVGCAMIANNLTDPTPDNDMLVNYAALGSSTTAVSAADIKLGNETYRNSIASRTNSNGMAYITAYYSQTECNGTYKEAGIFSDGTGSKDSGILVSHVNIDVTKSNTQKLTIDWVLEIAGA